MARVKKFTNRPRKVTPEQEFELIRIYQAGGLRATSELTAQYGVSPKYPANVAAAMGMARPRWRRGTKYADGTNVSRGDSVRSRNDPRWARAVAVGAVVV